ncbi:CBS domain-containing protein [Roseibium aestuarii]|uniref:CBS domain-containing protein n=1 Tax=Roseibium aestuarii TaxID=2600299 RepID=A0ABW4JYJ0_9HYPH|nr:CBS domain-containing protein [Roseibium aestuarii]
MTPSSYQQPMRGDKSHDRTVSQSVDSNLSSEAATVGQILAKKGGALVSVKPGDTVATAVQVLKEKGIGALLVLDDAGTMQGILSERDIVRKLAETPGQTLPQLVEGLMTRKVVTCTPADPLDTVLKMMNDGRFRHLPVLDGGKLCGMISIGDVVNHRLVQLEWEALQMKQMIVG